MGKDRQGRDSVGHRVLEPLVVTERVLRAQAGSRRRVQHRRDRQAAVLGEAQGAVNSTDQDSHHPAREVSGEARDFRIRPALRHRISAHQKRILAIIVHCCLYRTSTRAPNAIERYRHRRLLAPIATSHSTTRKKLTVVGVIRAEGLPGWSSWGLAR